MNLAALIVIYRFRLLPFKLVAIDTVKSAESYSSFVFGCH